MTPALWGFVIGTILAAAVIVVPNIIVWRRRRK
jgi:hypothetical protein